MCLILLLGTKGCAQKVYIASSPEHYLQIVLLADDESYILYGLEIEDERLSHFCSQIYPKGEVEILVVTDELIREELSTRTLSANILVDSQELVLGLIGAEIARQLGGFVYFSREEVPESRLADYPLIQIGGIMEEDIMYFGGLSDAYDYYKSIRPILDILVSTDEGEYCFAALRLVSERGGILFFQGLESPPIGKRGSVLWIAEPKDLSRENILNVYAGLDYFGTRGSHANWSNFSRLLPGADLIMISAHGQSQGFRLHDRFVSGSMLPLLRPGIINLGGCYAAAGIENTQQENILLNFLRRGAAVSVGSTGMGFSSLNHMSSPSVPLGEQVRLLNYYAWKNTGTEERAVLFGDPTLALVEDPYELLGADQVRFSLSETYSRVSGEGKQPVFVYLPEMPVVRSAVITSGDGDREHFDDGFLGDLLSLPAGASSFVLLQTKFDQGIVTFSSSRSPAHYFVSGFRFVVVALETFFRDYLLNSGLFILFLLVSAVFLLLLLITKIKVVSWNTLILFAVYAVLYLGINLALGNRFDPRSLLLFFLLSYLPGLFPIHIWKIIVLYLLGIGLPSIFALPQLLSQSQGLLHVLIIALGFLLSTLFPLCLIWVEDAFLPKFQKHSKNEGAKIR